MYPSLFSSHDSIIVLAASSDFPKAPLVSMNTFSSYLKSLLHLWRWVRCCSCLSCERASVSSHSASSKMTYGRAFSLLTNGNTFPYNLHTLAPIYYNQIMSGNSLLSMSCLVFIPHLANLLDFSLDIPGLVVHMGWNPMHGLPFTLVNICLLQIIVERLHDAIVDQKHDEYDSCQYGNNNRHDEEWVVPDGV